MTEQIKTEDVDNSVSDPHRNLIAAIIARSLDDLKFNVKTRSGIIISEYDARNAIEWIFSSNEEPWSFNWCCIEVNLNPKEIRKILYEHCRKGTIGIRFTVSKNFDFKEFESKQVDLFDILSRG